MVRSPCYVIKPGMPDYGLRENLAGSDEPTFQEVNGKGELNGAIHFNIPGLQKTLMEEEGIAVVWDGKTDALI